MPRALSLTFDGGPDPVWTQRVLDALGRAGARATFFVVGERVRANPDAVCAVLAAGHDVQLHCDRHLAHSQRSEAEIAQDTSAALATLRELGVAPTHWRTPCGIETESTVGVARAKRLTLVRWTFDTHDRRGDAPALMLRAARRAVAVGGVVLMHDALAPGGLRGGCENTADFIPALVAAARSRGLKVGPLPPPMPRSLRPARSQPRMRSYDRSSRSAA
jgi:peptidoglycan/xylan/chitin deacetylase (PgdA/CDA1 family)